MNSDTPDANHGKAGLRARLLASRRALPAARRRVLDERIRRHLLAFVDPARYRQLAGFRAFDGEPDLQPALESLHHDGCRIHLPVVSGADMSFRQWTPGAALENNRFGIPEPVAGATRAAADLDAVLLPLVGFGAGGARLGMGAGYYDRALADRPAGAARAPLLLGVAYGLQETPDLPVDPWDVPMDAVITEAGLQVFSDRARTG